jgi:hypothetical protein
LSKIQHQAKDLAGDSRLEKWFSQVCPHIKSKVPNRDSTVYLSVDLDFWGPQQGKGCKTFLRKVLDLDVPVFLVGGHEVLLADPLIAADVLVNVDFHSDYVAMHPNLDPHCGSWVGFVPNAATHAYEWFVPRSVGFEDLPHALCHAVDAQDSEPNPFDLKTPELTYGGFRSAVIRQQKFDWSRHFVSAGISVDPYWLGHTRSWFSIVLWLREAAKRHSNMHVDCSFFDHTNPFLDACQKKFWISNAW